MIQTFTCKSTFPVPVNELWAWHERPFAFERYTPPWDEVKVLERKGGLEVGARTAVQLKVGPVPQRWVSEHTLCEPGKLFRDESKEGPFSTWVHEHRFEPAGPLASTLEDHVRYELPLGGAGSAVAGASVRRRIERAFAYRHAILLADFQRHAQWTKANRLDIAITGASGMVGGALSAYLSTAGHRVRAVRRTPIGFDATALDGAQVCVHLAGAGIADARWTAARKQLLTDSRTVFTRGLVEAMERLDAPPRVLIAASAVGIYGDRGDEELTEQSKLGQVGANGPEFLAGLCTQWEAASRLAEKLGIRVVLLRLGAVMSARGGALKKMLFPFKVGAGGPLAGGTAWTSWVSLEDVLGTVEYALSDPQLSGPVNVVSPHPVTNAELTRQLGKVLRRPAVTPVPAFALRALYGELADGAVLASQKVKPAVLQERGFGYQHPELEQTLRFTLGRPT